MSRKYIPRNEYSKLYPKKYYFKNFIIGSLVLLLIQAIDNDPLTLFGDITVGLYLLIVYLQFHSGMWSAIQDEYVRTTPTKAAWLLLIPIFNFYWYFVVYPGFAEDYNRYAERYSLNVPDLPRLLFFIYAVLNPISSPSFFFLVGALYYLGFLIGDYLSALVVLFYISSITNIILFFIIVSKVCDAVKALTEARTLRKAEEMRSSVLDDDQDGGDLIVE